MTPLLSALIIDDEKCAGEALEALLELYCPEVVVCAKCQNLTAAARHIQAIRPDLVFLDIAVGEENGFDLLSHVEPVNFKTIFTTASSEYAVDAFKVDALDYLLKPIDPEELQAAVGKALIPHAATDQREATHTADNMMISTVEGIDVIPVDTILYVNGSGNYSTFHLQGGHKVVASKSLKYFERLLSLRRFFRSHQSYLVNLNFVRKIRSQDAVIQLTTNDCLPIAQSRKATLLDRLRGAGG